MLFKQIVNLRKNKFKSGLLTLKRFAYTTGEMMRKEDSIKSKIIKKERAFIDLPRQTAPYRPPMERVLDWDEINHGTRDDFDNKIRLNKLQEQASRCMDCGTPFCQTKTGCPIDNLIPEWNELVYYNEWKEAYYRLQKTNNFPEFTGRVCPAPCEGSCVAGLVSNKNNSSNSVTIKNIEYSIAEKAWKEGWVTARIPQKRTDLKIAIIGSGPCGLAAADELNQKGHLVTVIEKDDQIGGLLTYGIPNMKLDKKTVQKRIELLKEEGINFMTNQNVGYDSGNKSTFDIKELEKDYDAVILCIGSGRPRSLPFFNGSTEIKGVHYAMEFLTKSQKKLFMTKNGFLESAYQNNDKDYVSAEGKDVIIIGGGDTGTDCIATSMRMRCRSVVNFEYKKMPPLTRDESNPWPEYPRIYGVDYGHGEARAVFGKDPRKYNILTKDFIKDKKNTVTGIKTVHIDQETNMEIPGSEKIWPCDLCIIAIGFDSPDNYLIDKLNIKIKNNQRGNHSIGNIDANYGDFMTNKEGFFAAGDCRRGQSLVVWAINEGRAVSEAVEKYFIKKGWIEEIKEDFI